MDSQKANTRTFLPEQAVVLGFEDYEAQARALARHLRCGYRRISVHRFPDGESRVRVPAKLPPDVVFCRSLNDPDRKLLELILAADAALKTGAKFRALVAPYLCYMRQDSDFRPGEAVSQQTVGRLLAGHFDALVSVDPHLHRVRRLQDAVPCAQAVTLSAAPLFRALIAQRATESLILGPDEESLPWVRGIAEPMGLPFAVASKRRTGDRKVSVELPELDLSGRPVVLVDDVVSTGVTIATVAALLRNRGVARIDLLVTHALFPGDAAARMAAAGVDSVTSTDSIPHPAGVLPLAGLLAEAVSKLQVGHRSARRPVKSGAHKL